MTVKAMVSDRTILDMIVTYQCHYLDSHMSMSLSTALIVTCQVSVDSDMYCHDTSRNSHMSMAPRSLTSMSCDNSQFTLSSSRHTHKLEDRQ